MVPLDLVILRHIPTMVRGEAQHRHRPVARQRKAHEAFPGRMCMTSRPHVVHLQHEPDSVATMHVATAAWSQVIAIHVLPKSPIFSTFTFPIDSAMIAATSSALASPQLV